jgi:endonuclease YncB( thermonuclease family)
MSGIVGKIVEVTDGDTIVVQVDTMPLFGREGLLLFNVRLLGLQAPENKTAAGKAATKWVTDQALGRECLLGIEHPDKFGKRVDGRVWLAGDTVELTQRIIDAGHAQPWDGKGPRPT